MLVRQVTDRFETKENRVSTADVTKVSRWTGTETGMTAEDVTGYCGLLKLMEIHLGIGFK